MRHKERDSATPSLLGPLSLSGLACMLTWGWSGMVVAVGDTLLRVFLSDWIYPCKRNTAVYFAGGF